MHENHYTIFVFLTCLRMHERQGNLPCQKHYRRGWSRYQWADRCLRMHAVFICFKLLPSDPLSNACDILETSCAECLILFQSQQQKLSPLRVVHRGYSDTEVAVTPLLDRYKQRCHTPRLLLQHCSRFGSWSIISL